MLIDFLTERYSFSQSGIAVSIILYTVAGMVALLFHRLGQARAHKGENSKTALFRKNVFGNLPSSLWSVVFFLITGCLRDSVRGVASEDKKLNRRIFWNGVGVTFFSAVGFFFLYTVVELLADLTGGSAWSVVLLGAKALTGANLSLLFFSLLPLPGSEAEVLLRRKPLSPKGEAFRKDGTWPYFVFCATGILLSCITIPVYDGGVHSLIGILSLFPILLIGG